MPPINLPFGNESKNMLWDLIKTPMETLFKDGVFAQPENAEIKRQHRNVILDQGRADFSVGYNEINAEQKTLLYCFYYMQVHIASSYLFIYQLKNTLKELVDRKSAVIFIDFGCGPMTSGIAFRKHFPQPDLNFHYIGIDSAEEMIKKAKHFQGYGNLFGIEQHFHWLNDYKKVNEKLKAIVQQVNDYFLIFNFCYFFASRSVIAAEIGDLIQETIKIIGNKKLFILHQNPTRTDLNINWNLFRNFMVEKKLAQGMNGYPKSIQYSFEDLLGSSEYKNPTFTSLLDSLTT